jgi:predicted amidohydrolase
MLSVIQDGLGRQRIRSDHNDLQVLVAGSWHVERGGKWWNSAPILDGYGKVLATYEKLTPFYSAGIGYEDVTLGAGIPVIVTDDYVVAIAICKDFCDLSRVADLAQLDVDLFLVPSMGGDSTMSGHQTMAKHLTVQRGSRAFVVQQPENGSAALVLGMVGDPLSPGAVAVQTESADTYQGNFGN